MRAEDNIPTLDRPQLQRRKFLTRHLVAIGAIAATGLSSSSASANNIRSNIRRGGPGWGDDGGRFGKSKHSQNACFLKGTQILTADGPRKIEELTPADVVQTEFGGMRPIRWIGRYQYKKSDAGRPWARDVRPIRIAQSAIAPNVPSRDLFVSSNHCLYLDGVLIPAGNLVNGVTITAYPAEEFETLEYFHIKLESHDVIYAEGVASETLLRVNEGASNFVEYYRLYGEHEVEEAPCAPVSLYNGRRGMIASRIRSAASPWYDRRTRIDLIRDQIEDRGLALLQEAC